VVKITEFIKYTGKVKRIAGIIAIIISSLVIVSAAPNPIVITDITGQRVEISNTTRVVTLGSSLTEIIYALKAQRRLIAVDATSNYPLETKNLIQLPSARSVTIEAVLSTKPNLVLTLDTALPETIQALRKFGIPTVVISAKENLENSENKIRIIAKVLSLENLGEDLIRNTKKDLALAKSLYSSIRTRPKVMFLYSGSNGRITVSGRETAADAIIKLAGGTNPFQSYTGYAPLSQEATLIANPDAILMTSLGYSSIGGTDGILRLPGLANTNAGRNKNIYGFEGNYLLGFGPRVGQAVLELMYTIHPELKK
jgi:iron complex transport system substrate-binding protein